MNTWTISRRIIFGFTILLLILVALGAFAIWRGRALNQAISVLAENNLPSVLTLRACAGATRDTILTCMLYADAETETQRSVLEERLAGNRAQIEESFRTYEALISDSEDRRLFDETRRSEATFASTRTRYLDLVRQGKIEEHKALLKDQLLPAFEDAVRALDASIQYNERLAMQVSTHSHETSRSSVLLVSAVLGLALMLATLLTWRIVSSTNRILRNLAISLDQGATQTASAARQVSSASQTLSSGASEQAASVEETSASLEEISTMIRSTADNAEKAKTLAGEAHAVAQAGTRAMVEMTQAMAAIDASSAEVAKIVKNIDEIAFQTNILALNAAVEAARAGEAGAGFAVVADEVRSLAQRSAAAAKETAEKIEAAIVRSRNGSLSCDKVRDALGQISDRVQCTDCLVGEIATAAREQAQGIGQINTAINQMDQVTQSNSASAEESASAAEELDAQATSLKDMVGQLRHLVGGCNAMSTGMASTPTAGHARVSRVTVFANGPEARPAYRPKPPQKSLNAGHQRAIPMPGDASSDAGDDANSFKNF